MTQRARGQQHILALADRVRGLEAPIACSGEARTSAPIALRVGRRRFTLGELVSREWAPRRAIEQLERLCAKAVFGVGRETRADARVRSGKQLKATGGGLEVEGLEAILPAILEEVRAKLCPDDEEPPTAELHSLNVYPRGGHFVGHRDTPVDRDAFGTLVVCLPIAFGGGALVVRQGATHVFDWAESAFERRAAQEGAAGVHRLRWAAFYGDVEHEVHPVHSGHRVTLTWTLRRAGGARTVERRVPWDDVDLEAELFRALADRGFMPRGGLLGFPCVHLYAEAVGTTLADEPLGARDLGRLKGRDRLTALALVRSDLEVLFRPYVYETCAGENWRLSRPPTRDELAVFDRRQLGSSALERRLPVEHHGTPWADRVSRVGRPAALGQRAARGRAPRGVGARGCGVQRDGLLRQRGHGHHVLRGSRAPRARTARARPGGVAGLTEVGMAKKCRACGEGELVSAVENHRYDESGLPNVALVNVEVRRCRACGHHELVLPRVAELHRAIAFALIRKPARLSGAEIRFLRKYLGWSGVDFAQHVGVDPSTVSCWENDKDPIGATSDRLLRLMVAHGTQVDEYPLDELTKIGSERAPPVEVRFSPKGRGWEQLGQVV